ncbi:hexosaminidase [Knoellia remsis]|uniref:beta-N-acetylhexosaminidase n=1 Tax=Knoellia remsis TaxID=407159 RepID=A0A2T0UNK8_9MICO|nr:hexosaminidase [Knoellia remsis]
MQPAGDGAPAVVRLVVDAALAPEEYHLAVTTHGVEVRAADDDAAGWAVQTLRQLLPTEAFALSGQASESVELPVVTVRDRPRFSWRGLHLDVARHVMPVDFLLRLLDLMELHKLNVFHLHLTDDQGWRFPVPSLPGLTDIGSWRAGTWQGQTGELDGVPHGGFYTRAQLEQLVSYAAERGIRVVPEIDVPGHVRSLLAAYPQMGARPVAAMEVPGTWGVFDEVLWLDDPAVEMVETIYAELLEVFPSTDIHIGGDECPTTEWVADPRGAELAQRRGVDGPGQLQGWFTRHLVDWLAERGRRTVGWDEILEQGDVPDALVMAWRNREEGVRAARAGHDVVMAPQEVFYFDHYQDAGPDEPHTIGGLSTIGDVAAYDVLDGLDDAAAARVVGIQGQLWTEYMPTSQHVEYMAFPRVSALAENAWSGPAEWSELEPRLTAQLARLEARGVNVRPLDGPRPWQRGGTGRLTRDLPYKP